MGSSSLKGKWCLVTGASSGFGEAIARSLAEQGSHLWLMARRQSRLEHLKKDLCSKHPGIEVLASVLDVRDLAKIKKTFKDHESLLNEVVVLVNNAGLAKGMEPFWESNIEDWEIMLDTNVKGLMYMTRLVTPHMIKNNLGHIINIGSTAGKWTYPGASVYCASKYAVRAFSEAMRMDLVGHDIRVTHIEPGKAETEFSEVRLGDKEKAKKVYEGMVSLNAEDVAEAVLWSLQRPSHVNIQEMVIFPTDQGSVHHIRSRQ